MGQASLATFYVIFGVLTIYLNLESIGTWDANAIYRTISSAVMDYPFPLQDVNWTRHLDEVEDPEQVFSWLSYSFKPILFGEQETVSERSWETTSWNYSTTPATIASFNRILLVHFTFKRWAVEPTQGVFKKVAPYRLAGGNNLGPYVLNHEDRATLCPGNANDTSQCFHWQTAHSFNRAGGYTEFFDPMEGPAAYDALLKDMRLAGLFDTLMATCTVDMIVYNANVEMFLQYIQSFSFDFCGHIRILNDARSFNLNVFNTSVGKYLLIYIMRISCIVMLVFFSLIEIHRMWDLGFVAAMQQNGAVTDLISITTSFGVLLSYWLIEQMPPYRNFQFDALQDVNTRTDAYVSLCDVARTLQFQGLFIAFNLLVVSFRTISLVSGLHSNLGLILKVLHVSTPNFLSFLVLFGMLLTGFVLTSFFAFGAGYSEMSSIGLCIYESFAMLSGDVVFGNMNRVDSILAPIYFFSFYILFYLVLINIFVTLLMSGYDIVDYELQKSGQTGGEKNPLVLIFEELKNDVVGTILRYGSTAIKYSRICLDPILVSAKAVFSCSRPSFLTARFKRRENLRSGTILDQRMTQVQSNEHVQDANTGYMRNLLSFLAMIMFLGVWICLVTLSARGLESYLAGQATLRNSVLDVRFYKDDDMKDFNQIKTFSDVKTWADTAIIGLYSDPVCAEKTAPGASSEWSTNASCTSSSNSQQLLNRIASWNIGFLNTTFVRLTIQPACFVPTEGRWASGSPTMRKTPDVACWNSICTDVFSSEPCRTADGDLLNASNLANRINATLQPFGEFGYEAPRKDLGPFQMLGGLAFSLGVTKEQCQQMLALLKENRWFTENSASMVFDWLTYNGNMDLFTHNIVGFSLLETGVLRRSSESHSFSMNVAAGGGYFDLHTLVLILFGMYTILLLYQILDISRQAREQYVRSQRRERPLLAFLGEYFTDAWNLIELVTVLISVATLVCFVVFTLNGFRAQYRFSTGNAIGYNDYEVPTAAVGYYNMAHMTDPVRYLEDDWYFFKEFEEVQATYGVFLELAALNSVWAGFKTIKTINRFKLVGIFSNTLSNGKSRNVYFIIVIMLQMFGFALAMTVIFGTVVQDFSSPLSAMGALLYCLCGSSNLRPLLAVSRVFAVLFFVAFTIVFRFISTNMFLATQLNTFAALAGERDIDKAKKESAANMGMKEVTYRNKRELQSELELELKADQVTVTKILKPGKALQANLKAGDVVLKVNGEKVEWHATLAFEEYEHVERALTPGPDGSITIIFKHASMQTVLGKVMQLLRCRCCTTRRVKPGQKSHQEAYAKYTKDAVRPTVRNFWRLHGAIAEVEKESRVDSNQEQQVAVLPHVNLQRETRFEPLERGGDSRAQVTKRLHRYLFSRWSGSPSSSERTDLGPLDQDHVELSAEDVLQDDWDVEELAEVLKQKPVTGQEVWLDCLLQALEEAAESESPIIEVLRTSGLKDGSQKKLKGQSLEIFLRFYKRLDMILQILENKASTQYFQHVQRESEQRQDLIEQQNEILHEYVCELESEFSKLSSTINTCQGKKALILSKLSGLLDPGYS